LKAQPAALPAPAFAKRLNLLQNQLYRGILMVWRVFVFAQNAFDHQPQTGLNTFALSHVTHLR
jgi:hypothetical protein